ncbi:MAG: hypothetical protein L7S47_03570, partial [Acidimicrobiales bacterium]|nr:hypothetical protein [Acidimicrobiales bacterium]
MRLPKPPIRTPSSTVTTSGCPCALAISFGSIGFSTRASHIYASMPSSARFVAASMHGANILPADTRHT